MIVVVDFLAAVVLIQQAIIARSTIEKRPPHIATFGSYAVTATWSKRQHDDVDMYVRDPYGRVVWYQALAAGGMHLEHDDLGDLGSSYAGGTDFERVVIRETMAGEYVANVHMFRKRSSSPTEVTVELWSLRGADRMIASQVVTLRGDGDQQTAFRFVLDGSGGFRSRNRLPADLLSQADPAVGP